MDPELKFALKYLTKEMQEKKEEEDVEHPVAYLSGKMYFCKSSF
jgi:hypothetical protein